MLLIREAFLRGLSTRQVGRVMAILTGEPVSAQTVSKLARGLDRLMLAFLRSPGESQAAWEGLLQDLYRRGLEGKNLLLIVTDGCPRLAAAIETVYPRVLPQRCWVHKMRDILQKVRKRDYEAVKAEAQAIYRADNNRLAMAAFRSFQKHWQGTYPAMV